MAEKEKAKHAEEEIRNAPHDSGRKLDNAQFPCYGVKCVYSDGRVVEHIYPEGMEKPRLPFETDEEYEREDPPFEED